MNLTKLETTYKHFYQEVTFYISVAIPVIALIIDMVSNELKTGSAVSNPYTVLLTKIVASLVAVYTIMRKVESSAANLAGTTPVVAGPSDSANLA